MCEKCNNNFFHGGQISGQISMQHTIVKALEKLPFIWMGDKQLIQIDKREVIDLVYKTYVKENNGI
jgi:hypothetical protein